MRAIWKGFLGFGLVTIPVKVYSATEKKALRFNELHEACATPMRHKKWCPTCDREVPSEEVALGYEYERGHYVLLDEGDFEAARPQRSRSIEITDFVDLAEIDPIYFEKTYFLGPDAGALKAYSLLREAMQGSGKIALARVVLRARESLACVRVYPEGILIMETMFFPEEIRSTAGLMGDVPAPAPDEREVRMATVLVDTMSRPFEAGRYRDQYSERILEVIRLKAKGQEVRVAAAPQAAKVVDLMEALKKSVEMAQAVRS
ncbi:MAG: Ku protein [Bacillota bacterium]|jgi:DNA end-binding protein Ku